MHTRSLLVAGAVAIAVLGCQDEPTAPQTELAPHTASAARPIEGWFHVLWVDPAPGYGPATVQYELVDGQGHGTELDLNPSLAAQWGGPRGLDRRKVRVEGNPVAGGRLRVRSIEPVAGPAGAAAAAVQTGPTPTSPSSVSSPISRTSPKQWRRIPPGRQARRTPDSTTTGARCRTIG